MNRARAEIKSVEHNVKRNHNGDKTKPNGLHEKISSESSGWWLVASGKWLELSARTLPLFP
jgi:hypothetical protein